MHKSSSDSDESLEHMKLDLLKAKYIHQKLNKKGLSNPVASKQVSQRAAPLKQFPISSSIKMSNRGHSVHTKLLTDIKPLDMTDESYFSDDQEDEDIVRMNNHVNSILDPRRVTSRSDYTPPVSLEKHITTSQDPASDDNQRGSGDYSPAYNPSTDILVQWRLRRKLTEAKQSVKSEYQKHNLQINSLHNNLRSPFPLQRKSEERRSEILIQDEYEEVPVHDVDRGVGDAPSTPSTNECKTKIVTNSSCQCNLENSDRNERSLKAEDSAKISKKQKHVRKSKRTVGIMTAAPPRIDASTYTEGLTQTQRWGNPESADTTRSGNWDYQSADPDYIDLAIQKTLQTQLFDRSCFSAMSTVTSLNESQRSHSNTHLNIPEQKPEEFSSASMKADTALPWNEKYEMESDNEFLQDDILKDLRRKRATNLVKLRSLSLQIQSQTTKLPIGPC